MYETEMTRRRRRWKFSRSLSCCVQFRSKFLSVRRGQKSNPRKFGAKCNQRRREPANLYQCQWSEQPVKQLWRHGQQQRSAIWKSKRKQICRKSQKSEQTALETFTMTCIVVVGVGGETNETNDTLKLKKKYEISVLPSANEDSNCWLNDV